MVRAEPSDRSWDARSLFTQQQMGTWWQHGKPKAARKGTGHPTSLCRRLRISVPLTGTPPTYGIVHGTHHHHTRLIRTRDNLHTFTILQLHIRRIAVHISNTTYRIPISFPTSMTRKVVPQRNRTGHTHPF